MDLYEVFSSPFTLYEANGYDHPCKCLKVKFKTKDIEGSTTAEEVFILSKRHFDDIVTQYKNYYFDGNVQAKESSYRLFIGMVKDHEFNEYNIYSINYDNIKDKICNENKYYSNFEVEGNFNIYIKVSVKWWEDYNSEEDDSEDEEPPRKTITEPECIICFENKPNMLYLECLHVCVCNVCDSKGKFSKCPMCRTKIKNQKIRLT